MIPLARLTPARVALPILALGLLVSACATPAERAGLRPAQADVETTRPVFPDRPESTGGLFLAGAVALNAGSGDQAAELFDRASAADPGDLALKQRAFTASLVAGRVDRAALLAPAPGEANESLVSLGRLARAVNDLAEGRAKAADTLLSSGQITPPHAAAAALLEPWAAAAAGDLKPAATPHPGSDRVVLAFADLGRARLAERAGRLAVAEPLYKGVAGQRDSIFGQAYGAFLERRNRRKEAVAFYDLMLIKTPDDPAILAARVRAAAGRPAPAQVSLKEGAAEALIGPAASLAQRRESDLGLSYMRLALRLDPDQAAIWILVGDTLGAAGDRDGAGRAYAKVAVGSPEHVSALTHMALLSEQADDNKAALELARQAYAEKPDDPQAMVTYAELLRTAKRYDEAIPIFDALLKKMGEGPSAAKLHFLRAAAEERSGRWPAAEADLKRSLALKPDDPEVENYLGYAWADRGEHLNEAVALLQKAVAASPGQGAVLDSLGWAHFRMGDYKAALTDLERASGLEPADASIVDHLGDVYWRVGRPVDARYQWNRVLTLAPEDDVKAAVERKLKDGGSTTAMISPAESAPTAARL